MDQEDGEVKTKSKDQGDNSRIQGEVTTTTGEVLIINVRELRDHPLDNIIGRLNEPTRTRSHFRMIEKINSLALVFQTEPKNTESALNDESWVNTMHEELHQFERNQVWHLVPRPLNGLVIRTK